MKNLTFEINNKEYQLPEFMNVDNYVKIFKIKDILNDDEEYGNARVISEITGAPMKDLLDANFQQIQFISSYLMTLFPRENEEFIDRFELDGVQYGFLPSWKKMSFGEFADLDTLGSKKPEEMIDYLHILAAIYYRPITKERSQHDFDIEKYDGDKVDERAELFKQKLDSKIVMGAQFFFTRFAKKLQDPTRIFSRMTTWQQMKMVWKNRRLLPLLVLSNDSDGMQSLIESQTTILRNIVQSQRSPWWQRSINSLSFWRKKKKS
jgi:hypothetical protein